jgi:hypothetical protein
MRQQNERVQDVLSEPSWQRKAAKEFCRSRHFIKGPIPLSWFECAARLPGKAAMVGLLLWFMKGMIGDKPIIVSTSLIKRFGIGRKAAGRALMALEQAGLITADRRSGRLARVQILPMSASS